MLRGGVGSLFLPYFYFHHPDCVLSGEDGDTSGKEQAYQGICVNPTTDETTE